MSYHIRLLPISASVALALSACSPGEAPPSEQPAASATAPVPSPSANATLAPTLGGDGSPIVLTPLTDQDFAAFPLEGELACSFGASAGAAPLLVARGFVDDAAGRAQGLARIGSEAQRLMALAPGGFDGMIVGARFGGRGMTYTITLDRSEATPGGESPANPARLLLQRADGAERTIVGTWTCGP